MDSINNRELSADERLRPVIVGLAVECEFYNRRVNPELRRLYSNPDIEEIKALYSRLIVSDDHRDRLVALWLGLAVDLPPLKIDLKDLIAELQEMEFILSNILRRVDEMTSRDLSDWMNHLANAAYSIRDGFWMDAKIDMNRALQSSERESIEGLKANPSFRYEIELLQKETSRRFEELKNLPVALDIPEERLDLALEIQGVVIELMEGLYLEQTSGEDELRYVTQRFIAALRYVMRRDIPLERIKKEMELASSYLKSRVGEISDEDTAALAKGVQRRIEALSTRIQS